MALPLLLAVTVGLVWLLSVGAAQVRVVDAARETARALARGDDPSAAVAAGERVVPDGGGVTVAVGDEVVTATASAPRSTARAGCSTSCPWSRCAPRPPR